MIRVKERQGDRVTLQMSGTIEKSDYVDILPQLEKMVEDHGTVRAVVLLDGVEGWTPAALVEDLRFDWRHRKDVDKCAIVGETTGQKWLAKLAAPIFSGEVRFFPKDRLAEAESWVGAPN